MEITADTRVANIAARHPRSIEVFERHGIDFCCGGRRPLGEACRERGLEVEHVRAGAALESLRALSRGSTVPADACTTYQALYENLARFERELHEHVHLENNVLFPRVVSLEMHAVASPART